MKARRNCTQEMNRVPSWPGGHRIHLQMIGTRQRQPDPFHQVELTETKKKRKGHSDCPSSGQRAQMPVGHNGAGGEVHRTRRPNQTVNRQGMAPWKEGSQEGGFPLNSKARSRRTRRGAGADGLRQTTVGASGASRIGRHQGPRRRSKKARRRTRTGPPQAGSSDHLTSRVASGVTKREVSRGWSPLGDNCCSPSFPCWRRRRTNSQHQSWRRPRWTRGLPRAGEAYRLWRRLGVAAQEPRRHQREQGSPGG